jgi:NADH-quinone oxidoreductase subunit K
MLTITLEHYLAVGAILFCLGLLSVIARRNAIGILIGIELILNAANVNFVAFARFGGGQLDGQVFALFVIVLAACEAAIVLAIMINMFRLFGTIDPDRARSLRG